MGAYVLACLWTFVNIIVRCVIVLLTGAAACFVGTFVRGTHSLFGVVIDIQTQFLLSFYIVGTPTVIGGREYTLRIERLAS